LVGTDYNRRVDECREAARALLAAAGRPDEEPRLGRVQAEEYQAHKHVLRGAAAKRAAHFFSEMERVNQGVAAWEAGDLDKFGELMTASGDSSIRNYECGCPPLISLYRILTETPGVYGARFSGAGFRGCCVALVDPDRALEATEAVHRGYLTRYPELAAGAGVFLCRSDDGARILA
jgi:galactokinase